MDGVLFHILKKIILISFLKQQINILMHAQYILYIHSYYWFSCYNMADAPILTLLHHDLQVWSSALLMLSCTDINLASKARKHHDPKTKQALCKLDLYTNYLHSCNVILALASNNVDALSKRWPPSYCNSRKSWFHWKSQLIQRSTMIANSPTSLIPSLGYFSI